MRRAGAILVILLAGCGGHSSTRVQPSIPGARVAVVVLENKGPRALLRTGWLARAAHRGARAINAYGEPHPAQPYFVMLSGSSQPLSDANAVAHPSGRPNLVRQLDRAHVSWRAYMDGMPSACFGRASARDVYGRYAKRHDPFLFFTDLTDHPRDCSSDVVPGAQLRTDLTQRRLRRFTWITPNLCEDMHSCPVAAGERWMAATVPRLIRALGPRGVVFIVSDERTPAGVGGGRIPLVALGSRIVPGAIERVRVDHRSLLATIEDVFGLGRLSTTRSAPTLRPLLTADHVNATSPASSSCPPLSR